MASYLYSPGVIDHFTNPRKCRAMHGASGRGIAISPGCGDTVWIYIMVENEHISDISFQAQGCPSAIACASKLVEMALGMHLDDAANILDEHIADILKLSDDKKECSSIAATALHEAIYDYVFRIEERKADSDSK
jgi:nitrogen fixation NifU-like protein